MSEEEDPQEKLRRELRKKAAEVLQGMEISALANACMHMHEMFLGLKAGGFTEKQSLYIIAMTLLGQPDNNSDST